MSDKAPSLPPSAIKPKTLDDMVREARQKLKEIDALLERIEEIRRS